MLSRQHAWTRCFSTSIIVAVFTLTTAGFVSAQETGSKPSSAVADVIKGVFFDPTTYAPALISYDATMRDWNTSQPFFQNGYVERNARFTLTGLSNDHPVSYTVGQNQIMKDALTTFGMSVVQNTTSRVVERALLAKYPNHRKVVKTVGWIQRIGLASLMTYQLSAPHYHQAGYNAQQSRALGF
jgi:hypothetical protein